MKTLKGKEKLSKQLFNVEFKKKKKKNLGGEEKNPKSKTLQNKSYLGRLLSLSLYK